MLRCRIPDGFKLDAQGPCFLTVYYGGTATPLACVMMLVRVTAHRIFLTFDYLRMSDMQNPKPGYYWYTMANDPLSVIHIHENGSATLMGSDQVMSVEDVTIMLAEGERLFWIEPPLISR